MVTYGTSSFIIRLLNFSPNAFWEEACHIENESSFHHFDPEYVKVFCKRSAYRQTFKQSKLNKEKTALHIEQF
jgi:hypothetical protein